MTHPCSIRCGRCGGPTTIDASGRCPECGLREPHITREMIQRLGSNLATAGALGQMFRLGVRHGFSLFDFRPRSGVRWSPNIDGRAAP